MSSPTYAGKIDAPDFPTGMDWPNSEDPLSLKDPRGKIVILDLFTFGDVDGLGDEVWLQHPLGIGVHRGGLFIADTYNNKIKRVFPATRAVSTLLGSGRYGHKVGPDAMAEFHEPGGLSVAGGRLYVADTNNNSVHVADLEAAEVDTLELRGL